ncbi:MAG: hypothetical protein WD572_03345 [Gammaproteobacteria bacterium]
MNKNVAAVLKGYLALSTSDRSEFIDDLNKYQKGNQELRKSLNEDVTRTVKSSVNFGPSPGGCPCCGK